MDESKLSLAQQIALLPEEDREAYLNSLSPEDFESLEFDWAFWARPDQIITDEPYYPVRLFLTGRGWGKTRAASEWIRQQVKAHPGCRIAVVGRTSKEVRDVFVLGDSGIMNVGPESERPVSRPSEARLVWPQYGDAGVWFYSAEAPEAPRGSAFHYYLLDEWATHAAFTGPDGMTAADNVITATRLGDKPYGVITTTPRRVKHLQNMLERAEKKKDVIVVNGHMDENTALSNTYLDEMHDKFAGTRLEDQELAGHMLSADLDGVLWHLKDIHSARDASELVPAGARLRVVGVDPSVAEKPKDECGIVVMGATKNREPHKRHAYILEDATLKASPEVWAQTVVDVYRKWNAGAVVVEMNQGQHLVKMAIHAIDPSIRVVGVNSSKGKKVRAEPVAQKYEQGKVHHWTGATLNELEDQMTQWEPEVSKYSPDRVDALVHGLTALLIDPPKGLFSGPIRASNSRPRRLPPGGRGTGRTWREGTGK